MGKSWSFDLLYYFGLTSAANAEKVEQLGLDIRQMHDQTYYGAVNMAGKTIGVAALMHANKPIKAV